MAVIEIAKIQVRRGNEAEVGMPQLDSGEFGWAVDTQTLYIGNGSVAEGAPAVGNTQILTTKNINNFFNLNAAYVYGNSYNTGVLTIIDSIITTNPSNTVTRSIVSKLDDFVNVVDFGAVADGITNNRDSIQQAISQLYLNSDQFNGNGSKKPLRIPAGDYVISGTIFIPPFSTIIGDGPGKTVLIINSSTILMQFCDGTSVPGGTPPNSNSEGYVVFVPGQTNITNLYPQNIHIEGITFKYDNPAPLGFARQKPLISMDCAENCQIINCSFEGKYTNGGSSSIENSDLSNSSDVYTAIEIRSQGSGNILISNNILIKDNIFSGLKYGIKSYYDCSDIIINNNSFEILNRAVFWSPDSGLGATSGPIRSKVTNNIFKNIYNEGLYAGENNQVLTEHVSSFNTYDHVGNNLNGDNNPATGAITFVSPGNVSIEDKFSRDMYFHSYNPTSYLPSINGTAFVNSNIAFTATLTTPALTSVSLLNIPYVGNDQSINLQYVYTAVGEAEVNVSRRGTLLIDVSANLVSASLIDNFTYNYTTGFADPEPLNGLVFSSYVNTVTNFVNVSYTNNYSNGKIEYQYSYLA
jgi:hypothetical protein